MLLSDSHLGRAAHPCLSLGDWRHADGGCCLANPANLRRRAATSPPESGVGALATFGFTPIMKTLLRIMRSAMFAACLWLIGTAVFLYVRQQPRCVIAGN